jgi:hypothetical protein
MNQRARDEAGLKNLSDEELQTICKDVESSLVESEIIVCSRKLGLARAAEEMEFRKSGKPKRPPEDWRRQWFEDVSEIAAAHRLDPSIVWEVARKVESNLKHDYDSQFGQDCEPS